MKSELWKEFSSAGSLVAGGETATFPWLGGGGDGLTFHGEGAALSAPLAPTGRQLGLTAKLQFHWLGGDVSMGATRSRQPQHQRTAAPEWTVFTGYRSTW